MRHSPSLCVCESGKPYERCCAPYHNGTPAPTAEALMRSRYSAYVLSLESYVLATWHASTRPNALNLAEDTATKWLGLQVKRVAETNNTAIVEFVARYKIAGKAERLHEISRFEKLNGCWYYLDGTYQ